MPFVTFDGARETQAATAFFFCLGIFVIFITVLVVMLSLRLLPFALRVQMHIEQQWA